MHGSRNGGGRAVSGTTGGELEQLETRGKQGQLCCAGIPVTGTAKWVFLSLGPRRSSPSTAVRPRAVARLLFEPEPRCLAAGELGARLGARGAQGTARCVRGERPGCLSLCLLSLGQARESRPTAVREPQLAFNLIAGGDSKKLPPRPLFPAIAPCIARPSPSMESSPLPSRMRERETPIQLLSSPTIRS
jgi:hypothetical protein